MDICLVLVVMVVLLVVVVDYLKLDCRVVLEEQCILVQHHRGANTYDGLGGRGGMGYYGGGGGGGGWQYGPGPQGAGGGGGSSYASGLPPAAPVPAPVSTINESGTNTSGSYITFVSWEPA